MKATTTDLGDFGNEDPLSECDDEVELGFLDDDTIGGFQSSVGACSSRRGVSFDPSVRSVPLTTKKIRSGTGDWSRSICLPYMLERWTDEKLNDRTSLQVHLLSGDRPDKKVRYRVSSAQDEFIIEILVDEYMMTPEGSFNSHIMNDKVVKQDASGNMMQLLSRLLHAHAKTTARRWVPMASKGRDNSKKQVWLPMRIPLGLKVRHQTVSKAEDELFNGIKYVVNRWQRGCHASCRTHGHQKGWILTHERGCLRPFCGSRICFYKRCA